MKKITILFLALAFYSCKDQVSEVPETSTNAEAQEISQQEVGQKKESIRELLDQWHKAAGRADFGNYFSMMSENSVFIGTDASENWEVEDFKSYAKPHFDKGKAWEFTPLARNIYLSMSGSTGWFDELLKTHMGICRGSGVVSLKDGEWKIEHYVLSLTIPNDNVSEITAINKEHDSLFISDLP